nr:MAG TPA: hypothetical protein [Bacteriophage sp.]
MDFTLPRKIRELLEDNKINQQRKFTKIFSQRLCTY